MRVIAGLFLFLALAVLRTETVFAGPSLAYSPQRIIMGDRERTVSLRLTNRGDETGVYRIEMSDVIYGEDGSVRHAETTPPGFPSARPYIRFSPRQVRLGPGESQRIRVLARTPDTLPAGEYRVHAVLRQLPGDVDAPPSGGRNTVSGAVGVSQAVALPILVRRGETGARGGLRAGQRIGQALDLMLWREGNRSLYVDLAAYRGVVSPATRVGYVRGVAVPVPNLTRRYSLRLDPGAAGPLVVQMIDHYSGAVIDQASIY